VTEPPRARRVIGAAAVGSAALVILVLAGVALQPVVFPVPAIQIKRATYGERCGATPGNVTAFVRQHCDGRPRCTLRVDVNEIGDPGPGLSEGVFRRVALEGPPPIKTTRLPPEAGFGSVARLDCGVP
jgi:hypothetical protein